mgnify:CR=1 FL=1
MGKYSSNSSNSSSVYFCPQCGARRSHAVPGQRGQHVCESCGTLFTVGQKGAQNGTLKQAPTGLQTAAAMPRGLAEQLTGKYRSTAIAVVLALVAAVFLLPLISSLNKSSKPTAAAVRDKGRADLVALYESGGKISRVNVYSRRNNQEQDEYRIEVSDMQTGALLGEPQTYRFPWMQNGGKFKNFSDGNLYLQLKEAMILRFDPGAQQFVDLMPLMKAQFPNELGTGVSKIEFDYNDRPDCFRVIANDGRQYYVYWLAGQILDKEAADRSNEQLVAHATGTHKYYRYAPVAGSSSSATRFLLVQYWNKFEPGKPTYLSYFDLKPPSVSASRGDRAVDGGYTVSGYAFDRGLVRIEIIAPEIPRFNAEVLAENNTRLLLSYTATPERSQSRMLQLMDKQSNQIIWSRDTAQIPQLTRDRGGVYATAQALPSGFFLRSSSLDPGYLMDNQGELEHDFSSH